MPPETPTDIDRDQPPKVHFDRQDWLPFLADKNIPEADKREWIETVWSAVCSLMNLRCEVTASAEICGKGIDLSAILKAAVVNCPYAGAPNAPNDAAPSGIPSHQKETP